MIGGLISRQPVWKPVAAGVLVLALLVGLATILLGRGSNPPADLSWVYLRYPRFPEGQPAIVLYVDIGDGQVAIRRGVVPLLTDERKDRAIEIVKDDPYVQKFIDLGGALYKLTILPSLLPGEPLDIRVWVELRLTGELKGLGEMCLGVSLTGERITCRGIGARGAALDLMVAIGLKEPLIEPPYPPPLAIRRGVVPLLTEEQKKDRAIEIVKDDPYVQKFIHLGGALYRLTILPRLLVRVELRLTGELKGLGEMFLVVSLTEERILSKGVVARGAALGLMEPLIGPHR